MKKLVAFIILLAAAGGGTWYYYKYGKTPEKPQVVQAAISQGDIVEQVSATGTLEPMRRVDVGSQVSGVVKEIYVDFNSMVKEKQLLAEIDPSLLQVQVDLRNAALERQKMDIANQEVQLEDIRRQFDRSKALFDKQLVNQQQLETAELNVKLRVAQIESAKKQLVTAEAELSQAKLNVSYTKIYSPIDGVVVERRVDRGQTVQASMSAPSFFVLATDLTTLKLTAGVDESEIGKIRPDMPVTFTVDAYGQSPFFGTVNSVRLNATNQQNVVTYPVWIDVANPDYRLRPSMTAAVKIIISTAPNVVRVPNTAFRFRPNNDIWLALGLQPPAAGAGRRLGGPGEANGDPNGGGRGAGRTREGGQGASAQTAPGAPATPGAPPAAGAAAPGGKGDGQDRQRVQGGGQPGQGGRGSRTPGRGSGFGGQSGMGNLTPEQIQAMRDQFARGGGGRGQGGGGRGQAGGGRDQAGGGRDQGAGGGRAQAGRDTASAQPGASSSKIDDYFRGVPKQIQSQSVWTWDEAKKELKQINIRVGVTDGTFSELISGDVQVGQMIVTNVILPISRTTGTGQNPLFGNQPGRGPGGFGNPGGGGGGRGGGNPGGGGGGGGRGGGD